MYVCVCLAWLRNAKAGISSRCGVEKHHYCCKPATHTHTFINSPAQSLRHAHSLLASPPLETNYFLYVCAYVFLHFFSSLSHFLLDNNDALRGADVCLIKFQLWGDNVFI